MWRRIINGYPYKTIEDLGVANKEEAYTATKQAVYCYIHGNNPQDYEAIGEAGERTLRAMYKIINDANSSNETKLSSTIEIKKTNDEWKQDEIDKQYVSKTYYVTANADIENYKIAIMRKDAQDLAGIKVTNLQNQEMNQFQPNESFKVLIPIKNMTETGIFQLTVEGKVKTKPILYGVAPSSSNQDYALTTAFYEDGTGEKSDEYPENETKIILIKQDEKTKERLEGVEFELLDESRNVVYSDLKTNQEGKIQLNHLIPGKYFLREVRAKEGYKSYDELIELQIALHEQYTITVNNNQGEKSKVDIEHSIKNKSVSSTTVNKLPITGK